jgi:hypothetical protein
VTHHHNSIDDLQTSKDVVRFVVPLLVENYMNSCIADTGLDFDTPAFKKLSAIVNPPSWLKVDLDSNGYTDLLVMVKDTSAKLDSGQRFFVLLRDTGNNVPYLDAVADTVLETVIPVYTSLQNTPAVYFYHCKTDKSKNGGALVFYERPEERQVFVSGAFIEYNPNPIKYDIQNISYKISHCYGTCPVFEITIDKNKNGKYKAIDYNYNRSGQEVTGTFNTLIDSKQFTEIENLFDYINFPTLNDEYSDGASDQQTGTFTITYNNGKTKTIEDYALAGTLGLHQLHELFSALRLNQNWR